MNSNVSDHLRRGRGANTGSSHSIGPTVSKQIPSALERLNTFICKMDKRIPLPQHYDEVLTSSYTLKYFTNCKATHATAFHQPWMQWKRGRLPKQAQ